MRQVPKGQGWEATLDVWKRRLASFGPEQDRAELAAKIANLEKAIAMRDSLTTTTGPKGKIEFSL